MRKAILFLFGLGVSLPALSAPLLSFPVLSLDGTQAIYKGGTLAQLKTDEAGSIDLNKPTALVFVRPAGNVEIPYAQIQSWSQSKENAIPLGVAPTIVVGLLAQRHKLYLVRLTFKDASGVEQVAVFQVSRAMPQIIEPVLKARVPQETPHPQAPRLAPTASSASAHAASTTVLLPVPAVVK